MIIERDSNPCPPTATPSRGTHGGDDYPLRLLFLLVSFTLMFQIKPQVFGVIGLFQRRVVATLLADEGNE